LWGVGWCLFRVLLVLPCSSTLRLGDYSLAGGWRLVLRDNWDLVGSGVVGVVAVDSCKPGLVWWGEERGLSWCDFYPVWDRYRREPWRFEALVEGLKRDLRELVYRGAPVAVTYLNVKAYRLAFRRAASEIGYPFVSADPWPPTVLGFRSRRSRAALRRALLSLLRVTG